MVWQLLLVAVIGAAVDCVLLARYVRDVQAWISRWSAIFEKCKRQLMRRLTTVDDAQWSHESRLFRLQTGLVLTLREEYR